MSKRVFLQFVLSALLLFGQQIAYTHALTHAHGSPPPQQESGKGSLQSGSCNLHGVYGQILGAVPSSPVCHAEQSLSVERIAWAALPRSTTLPLAPLSRGPPSLL